MSRTRTLFAVTTAGVALVLYSAGVWSAGQHSLAQNPAAMSPFLLQVVTLLGAALAVNFGAFAGIDIAAVRRRDTSTTAPISLGTWMRGAGAVVYLLSLLLSLWFWYRTGWQEDPTLIVKTVVEQSRMLLGVVAGGLTLAFSLK